MDGGAGVVKLKHVATFISGGTPDVADPTMWEDDEESGTPWIAIGDMSGADVVSSTARRISDKGIRDRRLSLAPEGTVLFAMYASVGAVATLSKPATWNQALLGVVPIEGRADPRFLAHWLRHAGGEALADVRASTQDNLNAGQVANFRFPGHPVAEQRRIADFLDAHMARVDSIIAARREQGRLLAEASAAQVVSALIGGTSEMLRDAPWFRLADKEISLVKLKLLWSVIDCKHRTPDYLDEGYPVVSPGDISPGRLDLSRATRFVGIEDFQDLADDARRCRVGDIVYSRNASAGTAAFVADAAPFTMGQDVCRITSSGQTQLYLTYVLNYLCVSQLEAARVGSTFTRINIDQIKQLMIPAPEPQRQVVIAKECDQIVDSGAEAMSALKTSIDLLTEYRQSLTAAAVTGKLDVSTASKGIPA